VVVVAVLAASGRVVRAVLVVAAVRAALPSGVRAAGEV
jgi:hypothetical protein